ncbi:MAG TPA: methyltransferase domain-containing protein [bacterium]|nr:methyltransferase domain-containing protein [bacterium]HOL48922.1 methyltransferase domain-containing protein [bacterium]HPQ19715.1 methyltransferase domain-containing protein [bacterium]
MKKELLNYLVCPICTEELKLEIIEGINNEIKKGKLHCSKCNEIYLIDNYIPIMLPKKHPFQSLKSVEGWGIQWQDEKFKQTNYYSNEVLEKEFKEWNIEKEWFKDKIVLDAGCGNGRHIIILNKLNCKIFAIDLSDAINEVVKNFPDVYAIKGDMNLLPFKDNFFDFILARQVLQHTPQPEITIKNLVKKLKNKGYFVGSLYMTPENILGKIKVKIMNAIRIFLKLFPKKVTYYFTYLSIPFYKYKIFYPIARIIFIQAQDDKSDLRTWMENHDNYIAGYQKTYTREETIRYFKEAGLNNLIESKFWKNLYRAEKNVNRI